MTNESVTFGSANANETGTETKSFECDHSVSGQGLPFLEIIFRHLDNP